MNLAPKFCGNCGAPLQPGVRFCGQCGQAVSAPPAASPPAASPRSVPAEPAEAVIGVIPNLLTGGLRSRTYNLIVTSQRLIGAELTSKMIADEAQRIRQEAKAQGKGFLAVMGQTALAGVNYFKNYYDMPIANIVRENRDNWILPLDQVASCELEEGDEGDEDSGDTPDKLVIRWTQGKTTTLTFSKAAIPGVTIITAGQVRGILRQAGIAVK
jgi:hypothetical protein